MRRGRLCWTRGAEKPKQVTSGPWRVMTGLGAVKTHPVLPPPMRRGDLANMLNGYLKIIASPQDFGSFLSQNRCRRARSGRHVVPGILEAVLIGCTADRKSNRLN